jgi:transposase-like protein
MSKRRTHSPEFKARVAMEAISGRNTIQVSQWKRQLLDGARSLLRIELSADRTHAVAQPN